MLTLELFELPAPGLSQPFTLLVLHFTNSGGWQRISGIDSISPVPVRSMVRGSPQIKACRIVW